MIKELLRKNMEEMLEIEGDKESDCIPQEISITGPDEWVHAIKCDNIEIFMYKVKDND